jgi:AcrR family transcriptional regulator
MGQRQDLLAGAKRCIAEKGYSRTTARDIVAVSGANLAAIGYHFGSKEALLNAAILDSFDEWGSAIEEAGVESGTGGPAERLERFLAGFRAGSVEHRSTLVASVQAFAEAEFVPEVREQLVQVYGVEPADVDEAGLRLGSLVLAIINGTALQWLVAPEETPSGAEIVAALRSLAG